MGNVVVFLMHGKAQQPEKRDHFSRHTLRWTPGWSWFDVKISIASELCWRVGPSVIPKTPSDFKINKIRRRRRALEFLVRTAYAIGARAFRAADAGDDTVFRPSAL